MTLEEFFTEYPVTAIAFSGGCDSAYLLYEASRLAQKVHAFYLCSPFQPQFEQADAKRFCEMYKIPLTVVKENVLSNPDIVLNDSQRCYYCKQTLMTKLKEAAADLGFTVLLDGTNASDSAAKRPGMKAIAELSVLSPLLLCGLTKEEIRKRSAALLLFTHDKPAYACLATRICRGTKITFPDLQRIEQCEIALYQMGFRDFRVRIYGNAARIQLTKNQLALALEKRNCITSQFAPYFRDILLDLQERE